MGASGRLAWLLIISTILGVEGRAQLSDVESAFEKRRSSLQLERFDVAGERWADSKTVRHFDYLYYSEGGELLKIRVIEAASSDGATSSIKVDDYFFIGRELRMVRLYFFASGTRLNAIKSGAVVPMLTGEHIEFSDGKLSKWIALGKNIAPTDRRWADKQSSVELSAKVELLKYKSFKKPKGSK